MLWVGALTFQKHVLIVANHKFVSHLRELRQPRNNKQQSIKAVIGKKKMLQNWVTW